LAVIFEIVLVISRSLDVDLVEGHAQDIGLKGAQTLDRLDHHLPVGLAKKSGVKS
jgi:hypothetical protein